MADPLLDRDVEQALISLKKGSQLIKYSRKGKPKFHPFRLSNDESVLIWLSHKREKNLKLASVTRIIPGQRTAVFKRYPRPEKDYLSFSLLYNNGERSLDIICKDQVEVELWFTGLNTIISRGPRKRTKHDAMSDRTQFSDDGDSVFSGRAYFSALEISSSIARLNTKAAGDLNARESSLSFRRSDVGSDHANMLLRTSNIDGSRISISSAPSCSSQGSGPDDIESLGDVYVWGEIWSDGISTEGYRSSFSSKIDALLPKAMESDVVLDVHQIACGLRHVALVTRQGEVFTWGEECGGRLGHGTDIDLCRPRLVESLASSNVDSVACGEYHTCAITTGGDLFTWGDGTHATGLLGHGSDISHWIPKRVSGPLERLQVFSIACGTWHSALTTSNGKIYTFGDGSFGVLGHGDRESVAYPREIESLSGLRTIRVACGVWHTAAIVEVIGQTGTNIISRKLFTWGDGDKYRLGHGDKEPRLVPTCVPSLIDYNFHQLACGHNITVALTTTGHVLTTGNSMHGELGNPHSDGKVPCLVQDKLVGEIVEEIACGSHHVAVLTSRREIFTWGRGANGRLGHGDTDDRKTPALVEALKDRHVKNISCGSNFTACICIHKWVSGADQSICTGCRQAFGFTRKRHNCYNCGLVYCHACSSKKVLKAALAPTPGKPHRVCDSCYSKLKAAEVGTPSTVSRRNMVSRQSVDGGSREKFDRGEVRYSRLVLAPSRELGRHYDVRHSKNEQSSSRVSQVSSHFQLKDFALSSSLSLLQTASRQAKTPAPTSAAISRFVTPDAWKPNPSLSAAPDFSGSLMETLKKTNEHWDREVLNLQGQVKSFKKKLEHQDAVAQKAYKDAKEAAVVAAEESAKFNASVELIRTIEDQMKDVAEKVPDELSEKLRGMIAAAESFLTKNSRTLAEGNEEALSNEQFEAGVYVTVAQQSDGTKLFKRVKFSKRKFTEQEAEVWWRENQERVFQKYARPLSSSPSSFSASA